MSEVKRNSSSAESPEQNGVAERMNRTHIESARSMIAHAGLPNCYWAEAVATAAYVRNRTPSNAIKEHMTPYECWYGRVRVSSFLTAHQHILGYLVPYNDVEDTVKESRYNQGYSAMIKYE